MEKDTLEKLVVVRHSSSSLGMQISQSLPSVLVDLNHRFQLKLKEIDSYKLELEKSRGKIRDVQEELEKQSAQFKLSRSEKIKLNGEKEQISKILAEKDHDLSKLRNQLKIFQTKEDELQLFQEKNDELLKQLETSKNRIASLTALEQKLFSIEKDFNEVKSLLQKKENEAKVTATKIQMLEKELEEERNRVQDNISLIESKDTNIKHLEKDIKECKRVIEDKEVIVKYNVEKIRFFENDVNRERSEKQSALIELKDLKEKLSKQVTEKNKEVNSLKYRLQLKEQVVEEATRKGKEVEDEYQSKLIERDSELKTMLQENNSLKLEKDAAEDSLKSTRAEVSKLKSRDNFVGKELEAARFELNEVKETLKQSTAEVDGLWRKISELEEHNNKLLGDIRKEKRKPITTKLIESLRSFL
eukprot:snap_masked-scaffold_40-processed-gene-1.27-mRNA-1 protein AED:0.03 eAED:0.03 QI:0/-1/0/1/-1/1/1/0/415